jgi:putative transposase
MHTRASTRHARRCCTAEDLITELEWLVVIYGPPSSLRCDNGPELIADALREWCRISRIGISYIEPGSPWENAHVESFDGRVRDELLNIEEFGSLLEAQVTVEARRIEYNTYRPRGALGGLTPAEVRATWITEHQPALS